MSADRWERSRSVVPEAAPQPPLPPHRSTAPHPSMDQRRIGLTGGIASGKSTVGRLLAERGLPVLDADGYAREALAPGSPGAAAVLERFG
ncbi:dephospho-CoA kinase, partial [Synechococcus sp. BA-120 BA3]|nr:dephospho-CoA kinase [Synechococcus sp. BA-120 BA3]